MESVGETGRRGRAFPVSLREAVRVWTRVALQSFGGPAGQIAVMHRIQVEEKRLACVGQQAVETYGWTGITAAVVGVIFNLAVWFSLHTLFAEVEEVRRLGLRFLVPDWRTLDPGALIIAAFACLALFRWKLGMLKTLALSTAAGLVWFLVVPR